MSLMSISETMRLYHCFFFECESLGLGIFAFKLQLEKLLLATDIYLIVHLQ